MPNCRASSGEASWIGSPRNRISPSSGGCTPVRQRTRVDFPAPLSPSSAVTLPGEMVRSTPCRARTASKDFVRPWISTSGTPSGAVWALDVGPLTVWSVTRCSFLEPGDEGGTEHDGTDGHWLVVLRDADEREAVDQTRQQHRADGRPEYRCPPAEQAGT